jgi:hypothetical protein
VIASQLRLSYRKPFGAGNLRNACKKHAELETKKKRANRGRRIPAEGLWPQITIQVGRGGQHPATRAKAAPKRVVNSSATFQQQTHSHQQAWHHQQQKTYTQQHSNTSRVRKGEQEAGRIQQPRLATTTDSSAVRKSM